jgi:replicative DNA helicase
LKPLPQDIEAERAVLGSMLVSSDAAGRVEELLNAEDFAHPAHRPIYAAIVEMFARNEHIDAITVSNALGSDLPKVGGRPYLLDLLSDVGTTFGVERHAAIVAELAQRRRLIAASGEIQEIGYEGGDVAEAEWKILSVVRELGVVVPLAQAISEDIKVFEQAADGKVINAGLSIASFPTLEEVTNGFTPQRLYVVGGRPGHGKSALLLRHAADMCRAGHSVLFVTLEMSDRECRTRLYAQESGIPSRKIERGMLNGEEWTRLTETAAEISTWKLHIREPATLNTNQLGSMARRIKPDAIVLDYIQLLAPRNTMDKRFEQVSDMARQLKTLARRLKVPIVAGAQLNREVENRPDPKPRLSDLRETGELEQSADVVTLIYWPYQSRPTRDEFVPAKVGDVAFLNRQNVELLIAKNRHGQSNKKITCRYIAEQTLHLERPSS